MRIDLGFKPEEFEKLLQISDACYKGVERPSLFEFTNMLKHTDVFVAREQDIVIGFAIVRVTGVGGPYLWSIAVDPEFQERGVGGNLLLAITKRYTLAKAEEITLHVHPDNPAQKLYFNYGFRVCSIAKGWFTDDKKKRVDGLFMRKPLP